MTDKSWSIEEYAARSSSLSSDERYLLSIAVSLKRIADMLAESMEHAKRESGDGMG